MGNIRVRINGVTREYEEGVTYRDVAKDVQGEFEHEILLMIEGGTLKELYKKIDGDCELIPLTAGDETGRRTYTRGVIFLMLCAVYETIGKELVEKIRVEYSIGNGIYCEIDSAEGGLRQFTEKELEEVKKRMKELVSLDLPIVKRVVSRSEAIKIFHQERLYDKEHLFKYRRESQSSVYTLNGFTDYFFGYMPYSTGSLKYFDIINYEKGFVIVLPEKKNPEKVEEFKPMKKFFSTLVRTNDWCTAMDIENVAELNDVISEGGINEMILLQEALQEKRIAEMAEMIKHRPDAKFIMIAGPSSSGKTTFSRRLSIQLRTIGLMPHPISVDNYFVDRKHTPRDEEGNYDFEVLEAIDIEKFNQDMNDLLAGKTVQIPSFNFETGEREYKGDFITMGKDDILVIEGIHCLNDKLSYTLPRESKFKIYISALTQLNMDEHNRISSTDGRLIRRIVRDARTRGTSGKDTIARWPSVKRGEERNIFPFQEDADVMFNSALIYELSVLKQYVEPILFGIPETEPEFVEAKRILKLLGYFVGIDSTRVPMNSLLREFIGGSAFKV